MICELTGMEVANASMYDGSTGAAEAVMMAMRLTGRQQAVLARSVHPEYREVIRTYAHYQALPLAEVGFGADGRVDLKALEAQVTDETACVLIQSPNFFGTIEDVAAVAELAHRKGALLVVAIAEAMSLGIVNPPVEADIVCLEGAILRRAAQLRRAVSRRHRHPRKVRAADTRAAGGRDPRPFRQARLCAHPLHPRAAHPAREGDLEHLHQPGARRADGQHLSDHLRARGPARACPAEPFEGGLRAQEVRQERQAALQRCAALQ